MKLPGCLDSLTQDVLAEMVDKLALGKTAGEITDFLQKEKGLCTNNKRETVLRNVNRWRKTHGTDAVLKRVKTMMTDSRGNITRQVDVFEELSALILKQKDRLQVVYSQEDGKPLLLTMVTKEMKFMQELIDSMGRFQLATGIVRRVKVGEHAEDYAEFIEVEDENATIPISHDEQLMIEAVYEAVGIEEE